MHFLFYEKSIQLDTWHSEQKFIQSGFIMVWEVIIIGLNYKLVCKWVVLVPRNVWIKCRFVHYVYKWNRFQTRIQCLSLFPYFFIYQQLRLQVIRITWANLHLYVLLTEGGTGPYPSLTSSGKNSLISIIDGKGVNSMVPKNRSFYFCSENDFQCQLKNSETTS